MDIQPISTKQLRQDLPAIKEKLRAGQSFYWIDRSKPVGIIQPLPHKNNKLSKKQQREDYEKLIDKLAGGIKLKRHYTPEELNKIIEEQYEDEEKMLYRQ